MVNCRICYARYTTAPGFRGMDVTILNPVKDPDGGSARRVVQLLAGALA